MAIMRTPHRWIAFALLLPLTACNLAPDYEQPQVEQPKDWDGTTAGPAQWPARDWWQGFHSSPLNALIETAQANNTDIAAATARIQQAEAQARISSASLLPSINGGGGTSRSVSRSTAGDHTISDTVDASLSASYQLDLFGANRADVVSAEAAAQFSRFDREAVALTIVSDVAETYFQSLQYYARLDVARRNLVNAERVMTFIEARVTNGAATQLDLAQQRAAVAVQRAVLPSLELQARQLESNLGILLGTGPSDLMRKSPGLMAITPPRITPGLASELLLRRPDIQAAESRLMAANADIGAARAAFFPSLNLSTSYTRSGASLPAAFDPAHMAYNLASSLTQPIFRGGALNAGVDLAQARREELIQAYRKSVLSAFSDVDKSFAALRRTTEQERLQIIAAQQARIAFDLAEARLRAGAIDLLTVLDAQRNLNSAEDQVVQIRFARLQATISLFRALGGGWQLPSRSTEASAQ